VTRKSRRETVAVIMIGFTLQPIERAVVLLQAAALLQLPRSPAAA
jgi:hypothetical protein